MPSALVVDDPRGLAYDFGPGHPMAPVRLELTSLLVRAAGILDRPGVLVRGAEPASDAELLRVHSADHLAAVRAERRDERHGIGTTDCPVFPGMHEAAARQCGATLAATRAVWGGEVERAVTWLGGMHHAMPSKAAGFCVYNDAAVAIADLLASGAQRVAYVDLDVHHGDGVERTFWHDRRVLTISVHQAPTTLFPGSGFAQDVGGPGAEGRAVNVPLPPGTAGPQWLGAVQGVVPQLLERFAPEVLVTQHGADVHELDPLASLAVDMGAVREAAILARAWAEEYADGRWVALGGGGYEVSRAVPRAWAHLAAVLTGEPMPQEGPLPAAWRAEVVARGLPAPEGWGDGAAVEVASLDAEDPVLLGVRQAREAVLPLWGMDPAEVR